MTDTCSNAIPISTGLRFGDTNNRFMELYVRTYKIVTDARLCYCVTLSIYSGCVFPMFPIKKIKKLGKLVWEAQSMSCV